MARTINQEWQSGEEEKEVCEAAQADGHMVMPALIYHLEKQNINTVERQRDRSVK